MEIINTPVMDVEQITFESEKLGRIVLIDLYLPENLPAIRNVRLLLINDGQDLVTMKFDEILKNLCSTNKIQPFIAVGIHCGEDRKNEYGMSSSLDYMGRGTKASAYESFIIEELLPELHHRFRSNRFSEISFAGFSAGGLSAFDIAWNNPGIFKCVAVFSGSLWWRSRDKNEKDYNQHTDRLLHNLVRNDVYKPGMKFFFQCGEQDEEEDRNRNGVIDSIDDTIDLMRELLHKGYLEGKDMKYYQIPDGKHDAATWARAWPVFLKWEYALM